MSLRMVLIALGATNVCTRLRSVLRRRRHNVITYLRRFSAAGLIGPAAGRRPEQYSNAETLFRLHTGTVRAADLIVVCPDVPERPAILSWVMDQAGGVVAYCDIEDPRRMARERVPPLHCYISCAPDDDLEHRAPALERFVAGLLVSAP